MLRKLSFFVVLLICAIIGFKFGRKISVSSLIELTEILISFSAVVFAVAGVWLAIVYPKIMSGIYKNVQIKEKENLIHSAKLLLIPLMLASTVSASAFIVRLLVEPVRTLSWVTKGTWANGLLFSFLLVASFVLVISLIMALAPGLQFLFDGISILKGEKRKRRYLSRVSKQKK